MSSSFLTDLSGIYVTGLENTVKTASHNVNSRLGQDLDMQDFLNLMVESLKGQTIDNQMDTADMMNQMVQMSMMTAITNINELINQTTSLTYAASLVGKEVTVAERIGSQVNYIRGTVTGTGMVDGQQAIFLGDRSFWMSDILAVGSLPGEENTGWVSGRASGGGIASDYRVTDAEPEGT